MLPDPDVLYVPRACVLLTVCDLRAINLKPILGPARLSGMLSQGRLCRVRETPKALMMHAGAAGMTSMPLRPFRRDLLVRSAVQYWTIHCAAAGTTSVLLPAAFSRLAYVGGSINDRLQEPAPRRPRLLCQHIPGTDAE